MSNQKISALTAASTIDATNDYLPIAQSGSSKKINRNTFLGITSTPTGINDSQILTNKTLTNPTISGATLSGTLSGTYTIGGTPTFPSSVVTLTSSQILTNKTLTAPTINNGSITGTTVTTDAIVGQSASTTGTIYGLSITSSKISGTSLTSTTLPYTALDNGSSWAWSSYSPTLTNVTINNGTVTTFYTQIGKLVKYEGKIILGSTSTVSGAVQISVPVTMNSRYNDQYLRPLGTMTSRDDSAGTSYLGTILTSNSTSKVETSWHNASATYATWALASSAVPFTWATSDSISWSIEYEAA